MIRTIVAAAALATLTATPAFAGAPATHSFVRDGVSYDYRVIERDGYRVLEGTGNSGRFHFEVRGNQVTGTVEREPVSFTLDQNFDPSAR